MCLHKGRILSWPPTSHTVKLMFLYSTVSTLKPIVGIVVTTSPSFNLYKIVVFPAASRPTINIRISLVLLIMRSQTLLIKRPMAKNLYNVEKESGGSRGQKLCDSFGRQIAISG